MTKRRKPVKLTEKYIQRRILDWLKRTDLLHWRQNSGFAFVGGRFPGGKRRINMGPKGCPDIIVVIPPGGRFCGLEVKSPQGRVRPDQKVFAEKLTKSGACYYIVRSLDDAKKALEDCGWKLPKQRRLQKKRQKVTLEAFMKTPLELPSLPSTPETGSF